MKQSTLFVLLLGFGIMLPSTCSKKTSKEKSSAHKKIHTSPKPASRLALFGATIKVIGQIRTA